jgi:hypothetical protein
MQDRRTIIRTDGATAVATASNTGTDNALTSPPPSKQRGLAAGGAWTASRVSPRLWIITNGVAALSQDKLNFIPATVDRARGGRLAMTSGFLTQTISALVQSTWLLVGGALET